MKRSAIVTIAAAGLLLASQAYGQATRTWVSGVGDDANPCSRTAPCKTFAGAISKTAAGGEINALDPGGYGAVTITKSITIDGAGTMASVLSTGGTNGVIVNAGANDTVILRNLEINGVTEAVTPGLNGIRLIAGGKLHVENVNIFGMTGQGIDFNPSGNSALYLRNASIRDCAGGALWVRPQAAGNAVVAVTNSAFDGNGRGVRVEDGTIAVIRDSHAAGNTNNGFVAVGVSRAVDLTLDNVAAAANGATGVYAGNLATIKMTNTTTTRNNAGWQAVGGTLVSFGNNRVVDNNVNNGPANVNMGLQ